MPQEGITFDHHFIQPEDGANFAFLAGVYRLTVFAKLVGAQAPKELMTINLSISEAHALALTTPQTGIFFDWGPDQQSYHPHTQSRVTADSDMKEILDVLNQIKRLYRA